MRYGALFIYFCLRWSGLGVTALRCFQQSNNSVGSVSLPGRHLPTPPALLLPLGLLDDWCSDTTLHVCNTNGGVTAK